MSEPPFFLVWREGGSAPVRKHKTCDSAETEARRLAIENPGHKFFVMAPAMELAVSPINRRSFDLSAFDSVPF